MKLRAPDPRQDFVLGISKRAFHKIAYTDWGPANAKRVAICVHGLSRQGRDFDRLAAALVTKGYRVICPDLVGRGRSDWLPDANEYGLPQYCGDLAVLLSRIGAEEIDWIGTSLGGLIGIVMAGIPQSPVKRLVINDVGAFLPWAALYRIGTYLREAPHDFSDLAAAEAHFRITLAPFGDLADDEWKHLTAHSVERTPDGRLRMLCDPGIAQAFRGSLFYNLSLWKYWDVITCPTLVLRGEKSDLLMKDTADQMTKRGPKAKLVTIPGVGHAPALLDPEQIAIVTDWLSEAGALTERRGHAGA
jgi:pimeloyl-ACP methyl ester carboxylesterase